MYDKKEHFRKCRNKIKVIYTSWTKNKWVLSRTDTVKSHKATFQLWSKTSSAPLCII